MAYWRVFFKEEKNSWAIKIKKYSNYSAGIEEFQKR